MTDERKCPECGAELAPDVPEGLCPECLIKQGIEDAEKTAVTPPGGFEPPAVSDLAKQFPNLEILELIGRGGMGAVYKARQPQLDRLVALKILPQQIGEDPEFAERFTREARALAKLSHPHIVSVHDFGTTEDGLFYFVMEFVDGPNLRQVIQGRELTSTEALAIVPQVCDALQYAHEEGVVHRDIKPENLLLDKKGRVKIADFGLAKLLGVESGGFTLTGTQQIMGTPHYMAPEQFDDPLAVDHRADIYSLGVVLYEMLTGELPIGRFAPPSQKVQIDVRLDEIVLKTLENKPDLRYQQASDVKTQVETITRDTQGRLSPHGEVRDSPHRRPGIRKTFILMCLVLGVVPYASRKNSFDLSLVVWGGVLLLLAVYFIWDIYSGKGIPKVWRTVLMLLIWLCCILIPLFIMPQPFLDWLYSITGESPGGNDVTGARVLVAIVLAGVASLIRIALQRSREEEHPDKEMPHPTTDHKRFHGSNANAPHAVEGGLAPSAEATEPPTGEPLITVPSTPSIGAALKRKWLSWYAGRSSGAMRAIKAFLKVAAIVCFLLWLAPNVNLEADHSGHWMLGAPTPWWEISTPLEGPMVFSMLIGLRPLSLSWLFFFGFLFSFKGYRSIKEAEGSAKSKKELRNFRAIVWVLGAILMFSFAVAFIVFGLGEYADPARQHESSDVGRIDAFEVTESDFPRVRVHTDCNDHRLKQREHYELLRSKLG